MEIFSVRTRNVVYLINKLKKLTALKGGDFMYHIAICDDDKLFIAYMKQIIHQARGNGGDQFEIYEFCSGEELLSNLKEITHIDLLILDMELGGIDGDETAEQFRTKCKDVVLVFCSGMRVPTVRSFRVTPYRYLLKSYSNAQFICEMSEVLIEVKKRLNIEYIVGHYRNNVIRVNIHNILYAENAKRGSRIIVCSGCHEGKFDSPILVDEKLEILSKQFNDLVFAHSSYIINMNHIEKIVDNEVHLDNGDRMSISRTYKKSFRERFTEAIASKYS